MKTIAIIPALNEEETIGRVIESVKRHVNNVIVIDDGSTDGTAKTARKAGARVYSHPVNKGLGPTILDGYREALKKGAEIVLQIDADGQYLARDIPRLINPILRNEADMVLGSRFSGTIEEMPFVKRTGNRFFSKITSVLSGMRITDAQTGFRAIRSELLENIIPTGKYTYTQEMIIRASKENFRIKEVPIYFARRKSGESRLISNVLSYASSSFMIMLRTFREYHPLKFFGLPGLVLLIAGAVIGYDVTIDYMLTGIMNRAGSAILSALMIMSGILLVFMGLLADMMESKYRQTREHFRRLKH